MPCFSRGDWMFQWGKDEWKKEKGKGHKNTSNFLQNFCAFLENKSVSGGSFGFLPPETRQV